MKKNSLTATQRRMERKRLWQGAKWSSLWEANGVNGEILARDVRASMVQTRRGLSRCERVPGWEWNSDNQKRAEKRNGLRFRHPDAVPSLDRGGRRGM